MPLSNRLTVIITTSPTPSAPSTELLTSVLTSFRHHSPALLTCRVIVTIDNYEYISAKARLKKGHVTRDGAQHFEVYKVNIRQLVLQEWDAPCDNLTLDQDIAEYGSVGDSTNTVPLTILKTNNEQVTFIEASKRLGFGLAVRSALRQVKTAYVWVHQHDWTLQADIPVSAMVEIMEAAENDLEVPIKYICMPSVRMLSYASQFAVANFPALKSISTRLKHDFTPRSQSQCVVPLTPLFFWHDKPHIASTSHYLARVFPSRLAMQRGAFIEDTIGQRARNQMKEGNWHKWACWLYYPDEGKQLCLKHLDGRVWRGVEGELKQRSVWMAHNRAASELG